MTTILYARVSTADQEIGHQRTQAEKAGFRLDDVVSDDGVSGVSTRLREREQGKRLFDMLRSGDTLVVRWVDRLGRNYEDVKDTIGVFIAKGVTVCTVIGGMKFDGSATDPMGKAIRDAQIAFMAALGEAQADATKDAQKAGIAHAKANKKAHAYLGRKPKADAAQLERVQELLALGNTPSSIAEEVGISRTAVYRIKDDPAKMGAAVARWSDKPAA